MEQDRRDFGQIFRVSIPRRAARVSDDFSAYADFIGKHVRGRWHKPIDGEDITRILREAVRDGLIVPVIDRDWRGSVGVSKRYAPQTWSETYRSAGGGAVAASPRGKTFHQSVMESMGLDADGGTAYIEKYNAMVERIDAIQAANAARRAAAAAASYDDDLLGGVEAAAGAAPGDGDDSTPLGDAQSFDYQPDISNGDAEELAAGDGRPGNNQAQNKQFRSVVKALGLNQDQTRQLHDDIQDDDEMDYHGLMQRAQDLFGGSD